MYCWLIERDYRKKSIQRFQGSRCRTGKTVTGIKLPVVTRSYAILSGDYLLVLCLKTAFRKKRNVQIAAGIIARFAPGGA